MAQSKSKSRAKPKSRKQPRSLHEEPNLSDVAVLKPWAAFLVRTICMVIVWVVVSQFWEYLTSVM
jgi:hypothetical protein